MVQPRSCSGSQKTTPAEEPVSHNDALNIPVMINLTTFFAFDPDDTDEIRLEKFAIFLVASACTVSGGVWTVMYYAVFGFGVTAMLPLGFVIFVGTSLFISHFSKNHYYAIYTQIICIIYITTLIQWSIGGVFDSGFVLAWAFCGPITALMFFSLRHSIIWLLLYLTNIGITVIFDEHFSKYGQEVPENTEILFFIMNLSISSVVVFIFASYFVANAINEREKATKLLMNILPKKIAKTLKDTHGVIADRHDHVSVLFADIVGFTKLSEKTPPEELVNLLNDIFSLFDNLLEKHGLEKIKTIGDAYMVAGGLPISRMDHAEAVAEMAMEMQKELEKFNTRHHHNFNMRIGIHSGPTVAGVIGIKKFIYDVWGDTVNTASRMESHGIPGQIQVSSQTYELLKEKYLLKVRGVIEIKGKGEMTTYLLHGHK